MKKLIPLVALIFSSTWLVSCGDEPTKTNQDTTSNIVEQPAVSPTSTPATTTKPTPESTPVARTETQQPKVGTVTELVSGDISCYVTLVDEEGKVQNLGATFEVCEQKDVLNKKVRLSYSLEKVNDCQSAEPCGKTREESLISKIEIVDNNSANPPDDNN
ncbi:MAG TPA: hypothetical protein VK203_00385 [Nostocaceae cyanobacterium]|nr:hypothetical protein [Nostocaceae cyanobacterium]